ncbi:transposase [Streptomyces bathyalis]|uniref:transposase n=1 Tax=Streptomyces bathyalis TaxID=2710756 RepID=UPI003CCD4616
MSQAATRVFAGHQATQQPDRCHRASDCTGIDPAARRRHRTRRPVLVTAGDNPERIRTEAAFAKLCGVAPQPASSGRTSGRHRLSRGGDRAANSALYIVTIVRMRHHQPTRDYFERRTAKGLSKREIIRCLKRYIAREIYAHLPHPASPPAAHPTAA